MTDGRSDDDVSVGAEDGSHADDTDITRGKAAETTGTGRGWLIAGLTTAIALTLIAGGFIAGTVATVVLGGTSRGSCDAASVADTVLPTIVTITVTGPGGSSNGSGEIITADGYILTNNHVISGAASGSRLSVRYSDGEE